MAIQGFQSGNPFVINARNSFPVIQKKFGVKRIRIFGSCARYEQNETSDIDILVEFYSGKATFDNFMQLASYLEGLFSRRVDLITPDGMSKHIRPFIEKEVIWVEE